GPIACTEEQRVSTPSDGRETARRYGRAGVDMTIRVDSMYISPVKSLALRPIERARVEKPGIAGDRAFFIIDEAGKLFTQRQYGGLVQVAARYDVDAGDLRFQ